MTWSRAAILVAATVLLVAVAGQLHNFAWPTLDEAPARSPYLGRVQEASWFKVDDVSGGWVGTALVRPLFREDRRPARESITAAIVAEDSIRLTGLITGPFGNRAIFMSGTNTKSFVAVEGAQVGGFVVLSIGADRAVVTSGGTVHTLRPALAEKR